NPDFTDPETGDFRTSLFDTRQGTQTLQWGMLGSIGLENENNSISLSYLFSRTAEDRATLAEDTRGKEYFFPDYDPNDNTGPGNTIDTQNAAPYLRTHTLQYTERNTDSLQLQGEHKLGFEGATLGKLLTFKRPIVNWAVAKSTAELDQPDKRQFGSRWNAESFNPGLPPFLPPTLTPATYFPYLPAANFNLGNLQRIFKTIEEESDQGKIDLEFPFEQWKGAEGYFKVGLFNDRVDRKFDQDSFANFADFFSTELEFDEFQTDVFPFEDHPITAAETDVDYDGEQKISAFYGMFDFPVDPTLKFIGGARVESTDISIRNTPEADAVIFSPNGGGPAQFDPGEADVDFDSDDILPSFGVVYDPNESVTLR
ncbi:MAG: TonB-dependent receptor, partial [Planctomycetota bacterium]